MGGPSEWFNRVVAVGNYKAELAISRLAMQSVMAGVWVAVYGQATFLTSSLFHFPDSPYSAGVVKCVLGVMYTGAFVAMSFTGAELFTGDSMIMMIRALQAKNWRAGWLDLLRVYVVVLIGNAVGTMSTGYIVTYCSHQFDVGQQYDFLARMVTAKVVRDWGGNFVLAIACNMLVCMATFSTITTDDGAGKIIAQFYAIGIFCMGGLEHIIVNFYTLTIGLYYGVAGVTLANVITRNWIPVFLGNLIGGAVLTGFTWWFAMHPPARKAALSLDVLPQHTESNFAETGKLRAQASHGGASTLRESYSLDSEKK